MALEDDLYRIEEGFWLSDEDYFRVHVDEHCLLALPQMPEFHGVRSRDEVAATASPASRWCDLRMTNRQFLQPADGVAIVSYRVDVRRADGQPYSALISSVFVRRQHEWKLAFHQHSLL